MHRIAQVVQQLADDLALVFLLHAGQGGGVGRGAGCLGARFQLFSPFGRLRPELSHGLESSLAVEKITHCGGARYGGEKTAGSGQYMLLLRRHKHLLCSAPCPSVSPNFY